MLLFFYVTNINKNCSFDLSSLFRGSMDVAVQLFPHDFFCFVLFIQMIKDRRKRAVSGFH